MDSLPVSSACAAARVLHHPAAALAGPLRCRPVALGFWNLGRERPDRTALVLPDGTRLSYGELLARNNQVVHGLRSLGLETGDTIATVLPNGLAMVELYLACQDSGLYITPINHHLVGPEIAYIVSDSEAMVLIGDEPISAQSASRIIVLAWVSGNRDLR